MHATIVHIQVKPEHVEDFAEACRLNHEGLVRESGNRRFDVLQSSDNPAMFVLYEVHESATAAHKNTPHYLKWRDTVVPWMAVPRAGIPYIGLFPKAS